MVSLPPPMTSRLLILFIFSLLSCLAAEVRINEMLADNTSTSLADDDGDTPDWVEF